MFEVTKFDGDNYVASKFKRKLLIIHKDLWDAVYGTSNEVVTSNKALSVIQDTQIVHIKGFLSGKEALEILLDLYKNRGVAKQNASEGGSYELKYGIRR